MGRRDSLKSLAVFWRANYRYTRSKFGEVNIYPFNIRYCKLETNLTYGMGLTPRAPTAPLYYTCDRWYSVESTRYYLLGLELTIPFSHLSFV